MAIPSAKRSEKTLKWNDKIDNLVKCIQQLAAKMDIVFCDMQVYVSQMWLQSSLEIQCPSKSIKIKEFFRLFESEVHCSSN